MTGPSHRLIAADRVGGTAVYDREGKKLGHVADVAIDKVSGKVAYAILSFGGVLGVGERFHPIPWSVLKYHTARDGYVIPLLQSQLKDAPAFEDHDLSGEDDRRYRDTVYAYYSALGPSPFWL